MKLVLPTDLLRVFKPAFVSLVFMASVPTTALALNKAQAIKGCLDNTLSQLEKSELLLDMETWTTVFSSFVQENAGTCFTNLTGEPAEFVNNTGFILSEAGLMALEAARNLVETEKLEAQAAAEEAQAAAEEAQATAEAERIERQRVQSELETELAKLESIIPAYQLKGLNCCRTLRLSTFKITRQTTHLLSMIHTRLVLNSISKTNLL